MICLFEKIFDMYVSPQTIVELINRIVNYYWQEFVIKLQYIVFSW